MIAARKRKLFMLLFLCLVGFLAVALVLYALRQNISLFYTPSQMVLGEAPSDQVVRIGGMVEKGSIVRVANSLDVQFKVTDFDHSITVIYTGILPDLFRDGQGVVAEGKIINKKFFKAVQILAKHDANYMPPQVKSALATKGRP